ncbi:MAG TPA: methyltransferase domain-containing protein [Acidimicrobiia bacterium]|nr:methyltransferase domain-containing protein [Acidimicrobiia bacterium]
MDPLESHLKDQIDRHADFFWHRVRWKAVSAYVPRAQSYTLLDVGAGAGIFGIYVTRERPQVRYEFVEPIPSLAAELEVRFGADHNRSDSERLDDVRVVTLLDVLEHLEAPEVLLADLVARTAPGTTFIVTVPARRSLWSQWDVALGHCRRYERAELRAVLERASLELLEIGFLFPELVPPAWWRTRTHKAMASAEGESAEFPHLPRALDRTLLALGSATVRARRFMPTGTSLFAAARR